MLYHFSAAQKFPTIDRKVTVLLAGTLNIAHAIKAVFLYSFQTCVRFDLIKSSTAVLTYNSTQTCSPQTSAGSGERECSPLSPGRRRGSGHGKDSRPMPKRQRRGQVPRELCAEFSEQTDKDVYTLIKNFTEFSPRILSQCSRDKAAFFNPIQFWDG